MASTLASAEAGPKAGRWTRLSAPLLTGAGVLAAVALVHARDPHESGSYAGCPVLFLTGFSCPGCGGLRAVHGLTHGEIGAALSSNLLAVGLLLPMAVAIWLIWTRARWRRRPLSSPLISKPVAWSMLVVVLAFGVLRNLPIGAWLAP